jgi:hypothetical protein
MIDPFWHPTKRHAGLCAQLDLAVAAIDLRDYVAADRIRSQVYGSGKPLSWFIAVEIEMRMAKARDDDRRISADRLKEFAA